MQACQANIKQFCEGEMMKKFSLFLLLLLTGCPMGDRIGYIPVKALVSHNDVCLLLPDARRNEAQFISRITVEVTGESGQEATRIFPSSGAGRVKLVSPFCLKPWFANYPFQPAKGYSVALTALNGEQYVAGFIFTSGEEASTAGK